MRKYFSISFFCVCVCEGKKILVKKHHPNALHLFFKAGISKYNHLFEDISDQLIAEDIYNMIRGFLTIPCYIIITTMIVFISQM